MSDKDKEFNPENDPNQKDFLRQACSIAQRFINTRRAKSAIDDDFMVPKQKCKHNIDFLKVRFTDSSHSDVPYDDKLSLSWIATPEKNIIHINDRFWTRYLKNDETKKLNILFLVSTCIVHEFGHWLMQWSEKPNLVKDKFDTNITPTYMNEEAGFYFERCIFCHKSICGLLSRKVSTDWVHIKVTDICGHKDPSDCKDCKKSARYQIVSTEYIKGIIMNLISSDNLLDIKYDENSSKKIGYKYRLKGGDGDIDEESEKDKKEEENDEDGPPYRLTTCGTKRRVNPK